MNQPAVVDQNVAADDSDVPAYVKNQKLIDWVQRVAALTKPDRWFCSEEDAQAAGFRKAYNCRATDRRRL